MAPVVGDDPHTVTIANVAPTVMLTGAATANEGQTKSFSFSVIDPGADTFSLVSQSCSANGTLSSAAFDSTTGAGSFDCTFRDGTVVSITVQVKDSDDAISNTETMDVAVANVAPTVTLARCQHVLLGRVETADRTFAYARPIRPAATTRSR